MTKLGCVTRSGLLRSSQQEIAREPNPKKREADERVGRDRSTEEGRVNKQLSVLLTSAFLVLGVIFVVKPGAAISDQGATMDIAGLTAAATNLPAEQYPGF